MEKFDRKGLRTWIEIDTKAIARNYRAFRKILPSSVKFLSVVKSNAYGHGLVDFALEVEKLGVDYFGIDSIVEAKSLRESGITKPVLVLGYTLPEMISSAVENDIEISISTFESLKYIETLPIDKKIKLHIKVDTGMHRQGFGENDIEKVILKLKNLSDKIEISGLFTHFAAVKNPVFLHETQVQLKSFKKWVEAFNSEGWKLIVHASASGGALVFPEANFNMVRIGISQYGLWPSDEVKEICKEKIILEPVLSWRTIISEIKKVSKGEKIGYDFTHSLERDSVIAICPIGYWHGYPRALSNKGQVLVRGEKVSVLGRVSMDMITIDVTDVSEVSVGNMVTSIGKDGGENVSAEDIDKKADTSAYEIITRINPLIKRLYI